MALPQERRRDGYGFDSLESMTGFFSRWILPGEIARVVVDCEASFLPRRDSTPGETRLQRIQKAEFAIVRLLIRKNPPLA